MTWEHGNVSLSRGEEKIEILYFTFNDITSDIFKVGECHVIYFMVEYNL